MSSEIPQWSVDVVRRKFIEYFETKRDHVNYLSSPCVPVNDPTLLFTNAGMNQV
jgi:alanyl-tRNA synthetase